jgi:LmbE family N-acetylglucosaminyl deacetylase
VTRGGPVVVVSPHLDDAVLSAWLVLRATPAVRVVTCFAGVPDAGVVGDWESRTAGGSIEQRRAEDRRALALTGSLPVHLEALDAQYRSGSDADLADRLAGMLQGQLRDAAELWVPAAIRGHVDHRIARDAAVAARSSSTRCFAYADLPYAAHPAWPAELTDSPRDAAAQAAIRLLGRRPPVDHVRSALAELPGASVPHVQRLTSAQHREKLRAVEAYRSQLAALRCAPRNRLRRRRIFAYEVFWNLSSAG